MSRSGERSQKRKEVVEAVVLRNEPATLVARIHNITDRTIFKWLGSIERRQSPWTPEKGNRRRYEMDL